MRTLALPILRFSRTFALVGFFTIMVTVGVCEEINVREHNPQPTDFWSSQASRFAFSEIVRGTQKRWPSRQQGVQLCGTEVSQNQTATEVVDGYNCKGAVWIGGRSVAALFDTGASRNVIDWAFCKALSESPSYRHALGKIHEIPSVKCNGMTTTATASITHRITIDVTFKQSEKKTVTHPITFLILKESSTNVTLGKPTLDWLDFQSNRRKIYLGRDDIRFNTILAKGAREELFVATVDPCEFTCNGSQSTLETVLVSISPKAKKGKAYWIEPSPTTPVGMEIVEGPLVRCKHNTGKALVQVLCHETSTSTPETPLASLREMTKEDAILLGQAQELEDHAKEHTKARIAAQKEADEILHQSSPAAAVVPEKGEKTPAQESQTAPGRRQAK